MNTTYPVKTRDAHPQHHHEPSTAELKYLLFNERSNMNRFFIENKINCVTDIEKRLSLLYSATLPMLDHYRGEQIHYADFEERCDSLQLFTYQSKLYRCEDRLPVTTRALDFNQGAILVMDPMGNLFLSHKQRNQIHHSSLLAAGPVAYACMLEVRNGVILKEEPWSGHYAPESIHQEQFHDRLAHDCSIFFNQDELIHVFIRAVNKIQSGMPECAVSHKPLFSAASLPCEHAFNEIPIKKWLHKSSICPFDGQTFVISSVLPDLKLRLQTAKTYLDKLEQIAEYNNQLISKFKTFAENEAWSEKAQVMSAGDQKGLLIFLNPNLKVETIHQLAINIGLIYPPSELTKGKVTALTVDAKKQYFYGRENHWESTLASLKAHTSSEGTMCMVFHEAYPPR